MTKCLKSRDSASSPSGYAFDAAGRLSSITDANFGVTRFSYDESGNLAGLQDAVQNDTAWNYDDEGRVTQETNELGDSRNYVYDAAGDLLRYVDANGAVREYVYDTAHRVVGETWYACAADADAGQNALNEIAYAYDSAGRIVYEADNYASLAYAYNDAGQITSTTTASAATPTVTIDYEYDASGRRTRMATTIDGMCDFVEDYVYDAAGRVILVTQHGVEGGNAVAEKQLALAYNDDGLLASIDRYLDGSLAVAADYTYDSLGRLVGLVYHQGDVVLASYAWTYGEGTGDSGQATVGQVDSSTSWTPNGGLPSDAAEQGMLPVHDTQGVVDALMSGGYDALSQLVSCTSSDGTVAYSYDATGQLVSADYSDDSLADESYEYDANGNRLSATAGSSSSASVIGPDNRLLSDGTYWYEYDAEGNRTARFIDVNANGILDSGDTDVTEYQWDARNRLTKITDYETYGGDPTQVVDYIYDLENRWIGRDIDFDGDGVIDRQTRFAYNGNQIVLQFDKDGAGDVTAADLAHRYLWQPDAVDQLMADEQVADIESPGDVLFALTDHLGTVRDLAAYDSSTGETSVVNHITYDAYGQKIGETNAAVDCLFGFTGRAFDDDTTLQNNLNRWYDAKVGRWMSKDPIGLEGRDTNPYCYVGNSPTNTTDPSGEAGLNPFTPGSWWNPINWIANIGNSVGNSLGSWYYTPDSVETEERPDGTTEVTINKSYTIVILYGHGSATKLHSFKFNQPYTYAGFVGCYADATNNTIAPDHVIPGITVIKGTMTDGKTSNNLDANDLIVEKAKELAYELIRNGAKKVTIQGVKTSGNFSADPNDWRVPTLIGTLIITAEDLPENQ